MRDFGKIFTTGLVFIILFFAFVWVKDVFCSENELWIKMFTEGSEHLTDVTIDPVALSKLDTLMMKDIDVIFYGAADSLEWLLWGERVGKNVSDAWNNAKRLGRALVLRERYDRGIVSITYENFRGVKVVWGPTFEQKVQAYLDSVVDEVSIVSRSSIVDTVFNVSRDTVNVTLISDIGFKLGWKNFSFKNENINAPNITIVLETSTMADVVFRGGLSPFTEEPGTRESFLYLGGRHWRSTKFGFDLGLFRAWEFLTTTDNWTFRASGIISGIVYRINNFELTTGGSYSSQDIGVFVGLDYNLR